MNKINSERAQNEQFHEPEALMRTDDSGNGHCTAAEMKHEKSCGAVVFTKINGEIKYLLIANREGIYGFPKGHMEGSETEIETALREVYEETNIKLRLIDGFRTTDEHLLPQKPDTLKHITYFLGTYEAQNVVYQKEELTGAYLVSYSQALDMFQFESSKRILKEANDFLLSLGQYSPTSRKDS